MYHLCCKGIISCKMFLSFIEHVFYIVSYHRYQCSIRKNILFSHYNSGWKITQISSSIQHLILHESVAVSRHCNITRNSWLSSSSNVWREAFCSRFLRILSNLAFSESLFLGSTTEKVNFISVCDLSHQRSKTLLYWRSIALRGDILV